LTHLFARNHVIRIGIHINRSKVHVARRKFIALGERSTGEQQQGVVIIGCF